MAELDTSSGGGKHKGKGVKKAKKLSTRIDLTPMVDLGFLLITFFIFTTTMSQPTAFKLNLPKDVDDPNNVTKTKNSGALTILLSKDNHVFYYEGILDEAGKNFKSSSFKEIREIIENKKKSVSDKDFFVIIKPNDFCTYQNVIDILDEMSINVVKRYALVDISDGENLLINATEKASN